MAAATEQPAKKHVGLVVSGDAGRHVEILRTLLGPHLVDMYNAGDVTELLAIVQRGRADVAIIDSDRGEEEVLKALRMIRRVNAAMPVVLVTGRVTRRFMEGALRLEAFSIVHKPVEREDLLIQLQRILQRLARDRQKGPSYAEAPKAPPKHRDTRETN